MAGKTRPPAAAKAAAPPPRAGSLPDLSRFHTLAMQWLMHNRGRPFGVLLIYLDDIRGINETLGVARGEEFARHAEERVRARLGPDALTGGLLAGYLAALVPTDTPVELTARCDSVCRAVRKPMRIGDDTLHGSISIGVARYPAHGTNVPDLLRRATIALSYARRRGGNRVREYDDSMGERVRRRWTLGTRLRWAQKHNKFELAYQPYVEAATGQIVGAEALLRWNDPTLGGAQSPEEFVPLLEDAALIVPVGAWVLRTACAQAHAWADAGLPAITLSVNLSPRQLEHPTLIYDVGDALEKTRWPAQSLVLEITESAMLHDIELTRATVEALFLLGVRVVMDDFGTGHSSLRYLKHLPVWGLKIDREFVRGLPADRSDLMITEAVVTLAHRFGLATVAEGAESLEQAALLQKLGVDWVQGFCYSPGVSASEFAELLDRQPFVRKRRKAPETPRTAGRARKKAST